MTRISNSRRSAELGGITILVSLMLLVLITIVAVSMSKNTLREVVISGTTRQASQVRNLADTGLEWSIYWMADDLTGTRSAPASSSGAKALRDQRDTFISSQQTGVPSAAISNADMTLATTNGISQRFQLVLTYMGNPRLKYTQSDVRASSISAASPGTVQLWSVRSDGILDYGSGPTFVHRREAWFTMPPTTVQ